MPGSELGSQAGPIDPDGTLHLAASSDTIVWNGVAVVEERVFVCGPRWADSTGPAMAIVNSQNTLRPYPDESWNDWKAGSDPRRAFVNVNAIHLDDAGHIWAVDTGSPEFGGDPLSGGAKLVCIDLATDSVTRIYTAGPDIAFPGSYIDDIRFNGRHAYLTDAGLPGLIVLDVETGFMRRVLDGHPSVIAPIDRKIILSGHVLQTQDGRPVRVHADPLEVSPDGAWFYYGSLHGPWSKLQTRYLDDASLGGAELGALVEPWADLPPVGGAVMDHKGDLYFTDLAVDTLRCRLADGTIKTIIQDERLHWADAPFIDAARRLWLPVPQMDR
jgi:hypothetical protein